MHSLQLLIVSNDVSVRPEVEEALRGAGRRDVVLHAARDLTRGVDLARDWSPRLVLVEMTGDMEALKSTVRELKAVSPHSAIAGVYRPDAFAPRVWEQASEGAVFVEGLRAGIQDFLRRPISAADLRQLLERLDASAPAPSAAATTIAFISNKGGVGKSTLAINVAARLAQRHPGDVLLIDTSLQMGVCAPMLDLHPRTTLLDALRERTRLDTTLIRQLATPHSSGLDLLAAPPDAVAATEIGDELLTRVLNLARRTYRFVVVDTFPLFDRVVMSVLDASNLAYIVIDNVVPTVLSAVQLLRLLDGLRFPPERRRLVVNRYSRISGNPTLADIENSLGIPVDHLLPMNSRAVTAANLGRPFALSPRFWSGLEKGLRGIVAEVESVQPAVVPQPQAKGDLKPDIDANPDRVLAPLETGS